MSGRLFHLVSLLVSLALVLLGLSAAPAHAQARVIETTPADGASVQELDEVRVTFDSLLLADGASIEIVRANGDAAPVAVEVRVEGSTLVGVVSGEWTSGDYQISHRVRSADGVLNQGTLAVSIDAPGQAFSGGLLAVIGIFVALSAYMAVVFRSDVRRRSARQRRPARSDSEPRHA